jgi:YggT family protein
VTIVCVALQVYFLILIARIILSWVTAFSRRPMSPQFQPIVKLIYDLTEPVMGPLRRLIPPIGGLDISPIIIFLALSVIRNSLCS